VGNVKFRMQHKRTGRGRSKNRREGNNPGRSKRASDSFWLKGGGEHSTQGRGESKKDLEKPGKENKKKEDYKGKNLLFGANRRGEDRRENGEVYKKLESTRKRGGK